MKIGLVLSSAPAYSETFFNSKIKGLQEQGHEVTLFCSVNENNFSLCDVKLFSRQYRNPLKQVLTLLYVYIGLFPYLKSILKFCKIERQHGVAWTRIAKRIYTYAPIFKSPLHWLHFGFGTLVLGCENLAAAKQSKMAVSFRGFDIGVYPIKNPNCYARLWETVDKIHVISNDIKQLLYSNGFKDQAPIVKITPAINTQYFSVSKQKQYTNPVQLITVARLHWKKGLHYTLEALALLKAEGIPFRYNIIGTGPETEALKFACYQLGLGKETVFLGKLDHNQVKNALEKAQIYIQYSVQEGFCNAVLEAQAMGLLCVVSDAEGLSENVLHNKTGWVVSKRNPKALANKILEVIHLPEEEKNRVCNQSQIRIKETFNLDIQKQLFHSFYK